MPSSGATGLVLPVPAADPLRAAAAGRDTPDRAEQGVRAHVSLLYPFLPNTEVGQATLDWLTGFAAKRRPVELVFTEVRRDGGFVYLDCPEVDPLIAGIRAHWPKIVPYEGQYGDNPPPHLTVGMNLTESAAVLHAQRASALLPLRALATEIWLVALEDVWRGVARFPLG